MSNYEINTNPNTQVCKVCKCKRHLFLFNRNDGVCNWCDSEEKEMEKTHEMLSYMSNHPREFNIPKN